MKKKILIEGMSCQHCVGHVTEALGEICGVKSVNVDLDNKNAVVDLAHPVDDVKFKEAIDEAGYEVVGIEEI
ncbi:heavy-metal-associated domain-containing protein [Aminipila sp.]|uniref:heavy-metal-associated domain-containing protein n=1 Tax=Aminipila sp. TaxID=2060095 RepID=UPI000EE14A69|nr:copper ion binding protein [Aminipila sp.]HCX63240.1 heavy metal transport/detoxification protein [Clostridiales bacterium]